MSLQEMKEEFKQSEGDPHIKGRIRQLRQARMKKRMMAAVPKASVIITNPTHYAVALSYERGMAAPICVAKGVDRSRSRSGKSPASTTSRSSRTCRWRAPCMPPWRSTTKSRWNTTMRSPRSSATSWASSAGFPAGGREPDGRTSAEIVPEMAAIGRNSRVMDLRLPVRFRHSGARRAAKRVASMSDRPRPLAMTAEPDNDPPREPIDRARAGAARRQHRAGAAGGRGRSSRPRSRLMTIGRAQAQPYILGLLALLAMVGLFSLFAFAAGIIRFADRAADDPVMGRIADHAFDGLAVTDSARPRGLFQRRLSRADGGRDRARRAPGRAGLHRQSRCVGGGVPPAQGGARRQAAAGRSPHRRLRRRPRPLAADAGAAARPEQARGEIRGVVDRRHHPRPRAPGRRLPGTAARDRISRSCAVRLLLGQSRGRPRLCQRHAGELAGSRSRRDRLGRPEADRHRVRRRRLAADLDRAGARRGQNRGVRHRSAHARRQDHAGAALSQAGVRRRRRARRVAHAGDQPRARRAFRSAARRRSPLHALLRSHPDGDCDRGPGRRGGARQCPLRQAGAKPRAPTAPPASRSSAAVNAARPQPADRGHQPGRRGAGRHSRRSRRCSTAPRSAGGSSSSPRSRKTSARPKPPSSTCWRPPSGARWRTRSTSRRRWTWSASSPAASRTTSTMCSPPS